MSDRKPAGISKQDWERTPAAVRAMLMQSMERLAEQASRQGIEATMAYDPGGQEEQPSVLDTRPSDEGATFAMPLDEPEEEDGATFAMPLDEPEEEDGATFAMPLDEPEEEDGATFAMPLDEPEEEDGATFAMPLDEPEEEDGATAYMAGLAATEAVEDDGATAYMADETIETEDDGATFAMPLDETVADDEGATAYMAGLAATEAIENDGATAYMADEAEDDGATAYMADEAEDDGATAYMADEAEDDGATAYMAEETPDDGATAYVPSAQRTPSQAASKAKTAESKAATRKTEDNLEKRNIVLQERYRLKKILGKGGFGAAYLAEDIKLKRGCVVKQMLNPRGISPQELELNRANFEREAALLVQLNHPGHPNIPEIFDYFTDESGSYLVMKYIEGQSLKDMIGDQEEGRILWKEAVRHTMDVCSALNYMHTHGQEPVMHRDIKPQNVLLGDDGRIWLVDFGLAKVNPVERTSDLEKRQAAGSVGYTPFEQWLGEAVPASDVYATGVTLHYLVTGQDPLDAYREDGKIKATIDKLRDLHGRLDPIRQADRELPQELDEIIRNAAAPDPGQRPSALQLQEQLEVLVSGAQEAPLFTFKSGEAAHTIGELVDLCEQNRVEAQGYLYRGDFERWFILINRNDLAEAAKKAVKYGEKGKDGLEKFLKLIMPNLFWRRLGRAGIKVGRVGVQLLLILLIAGAIVVALGTFGARWLLQRSIAAYDWDYYALELEDDNVFSQAYLTDQARTTTEGFLQFIQIDPIGPEQVTINANVASVLWLEFPFEVQLEEQKPRVTLTEINDLPLAWITNNLSAGINNGIDEAFARAPIDLTSLEINDEAIIVDVEKSERVAWLPPTPIPNATPTPAPTATPSPTPRGQALLAIFNDLDRDIILEIEGQTWPIEARDTEVIEKLPGTYNYTVRYAENGQVAAQGNKSWTYRAYKWRIGVDGDTLE